MGIFPNKMKNIYKMSWSCKLLFEENYIVNIKREYINCTMSWMEGRTTRIQSNKRGVIFLKNIKMMRIFGVGEDPVCVSKFH